MATLDIPGAFLQADMDELVHVKFEVIMTELLSKIDPKLYGKYVVIERVQTIFVPYITLPRREYSYFLSFIFSFGKESISYFLLLFSSIRVRGTLILFLLSYLDYEKEVLYPT